MASMKVKSVNGVTARAKKKKKFAKVDIKAEQRESQEPNHLFCTGLGAQSDRWPACNDRFVNCAEGNLPKTFKRSK